MSIILRKMPSEMSCVLIILMFHCWRQKEAVDGLVRAASTELSAALVDNRLCLLVAAAFNACNKDFWTKIEGHIKLGTDSEQVVGKKLICLFISSLKTKKKTMV